MQPVGFAGANVAGIFEFVDKQIYSFHSAVHNVDFVAYFSREQQITLVCTLKYILSTIQVAVTN